MTDDATGSDDVTGPGIHVKYDGLTAELTAAESQTLVASRKAAFFVLAACALLASVGAVYFWYLWVLTAKSCIETYILKTAPPLILQSTSATSPQDMFIQLDISSFSALILAVFLTRLAYGGVRNTIRFFHRDGRSYFARAYRSVLFTEGFETLCVRFGLLGTLLSFLLAAVTQLSPVATTPATPQGQSMAEVTDAIAQDPSGSAGTAGEISAQESGSPAPSEESEYIFLLLCASLVSTFVGTGVAYAITPSLNWLNERAVGLHQMGQVDGEFVADEFFRQITRTSRRLAQFETTTVKLAAAAEHISSFEVSVGTAAGKLVELTAGLERAVQTFDVSTQTGRQLSKKLDQLESMSDRMSTLLDRLPERLNDPLKNMSLMAKEFRDAAISGETAFRELKEVAASARGPLTETTNRTNTTWQMLREVQESLRELAKSEERQTSEVSKLVQAFDNIGVSLVGVIRQMESLGTQLRQRDGNDHQAARPLAAGRSSFPDSTGHPGDDGQSLTRHGYARPAGDHDRSLPWWRRILG